MHPLVKTFNNCRASSVTQEHRYYLTSQQIQMLNAKQVRLSGLDVMEETQINENGDYESTILYLTRYNSNRGQSRIKIIYHASHNRDFALGEVESWGIANNSKVPCMRAKNYCRPKGNMKFLTGLGALVTHCESIGLLENPLNFAKLSWEDSLKLPRAMIYCGQTRISILAYADTVRDFASQSSKYFESHIRIEFGEFIYDSSIL
jgi:hypothetical protein